MDRGAGLSVPPLGTVHVLYVTAASLDRAESDAARQVCETDDTLVPTLFEQFDSSVSVTTTTPSTIGDRVRADDVDCVVCEHTDETDGLAVAETVAEAAPDLPVVLWTTDISAATEALRCGVTDVVPVEDGLPPIDVLITRVHEAVLTGHESTWHRELVEQTGEGIAIHDAETGDILAANRRLYELVGADPSTRDSLDLADIVAETGAFTEASARELVRQAAAEGTQTFEWLDETVDGEQLWADVTLESIRVRDEQYVVASIDRTNGTNAAVTHEGFRTTLERIDDAFFALDTDYRFTYLNAAAEELFGLDFAETLGVCLPDACPELAGVAPAEAYRDAIESQEPQSLEHQFEPFDGWYEMTVYPTDDGVSVFLRDVTTRHERERVLRRLLETTRELMTADSTTPVVDTITEATESILGFEFNGVRLFDAERDELVAAAMTPQARDLFGALPPLEGGGAVFEAFEAGEPTIVGDISGRTELPDQFYAPLQSFLILPLGRHGVLSIGSREPHAFDDQDRALGSLLAANATAALDRVARQDNLRRYERVIETLDEMVFAADDEGRLQFVSDSLATRLDVSQTALEGAHVSRLFDREVTTEFEALFASSEPAGRTTQTFETTLAVPGSSGLAVEVELSARPSGVHTQSAVGIVRDISELTATRDRLVAERNHFRYLFENLPDPVDEVTFDADGTPVVYNANPAFERTFGGGDDVIGRPIQEVLPANADESLPPEASHVAVDAPNPGETTHSGEFRCRTHEGPRDFLFKRIGFTLDDTDRAFGVYFDVTERRQRERYLTLVNRVLRHNLRNDLNVVIGYATELTAAADDPELAAQAATIADIARDLTSAADDARTLENMVGRPVDSDTTVDLVSVVREVVGSVDTPDAIDLQLPDSAAVFGTSRLRVAVEHLLDNAFEHTRADTPKVRVVVDTATDEGHWTELRVMDDGPGIPETERALITDERDATPLEHGSGLGLWLVKTVTESLGGEVAFETAALGGAEVVLRLRTAT